MRALLSGISDVALQALQDACGDRLRLNVPLARYTSARVGGPAEALIEVRSAVELARTAELLWGEGLPFIVLGGGSNLLVSDAGVRGAVILNRARRVRFEEKTHPPTVWAESGANLGAIARQAAERGLSGLEWAAGIPGTLGGAIVGNAGAHGQDMAGMLLLAEILHHDPTDRTTIARREEWTVERFAYGYRSSILKHASSPEILSDDRPKQPATVVLAARLGLTQSDPQTVKERMEEYATYRRRTQPPGASMGSMFKNPPGDYAGRLIEAAGLKGVSIGAAQISPLHANFFVNRGGASAKDILTLIEMARQRVAERFGVLLELEVELVGEWS